MHVVRVAKGFEMKVLVFDIVKNKELAKSLGFTYTSMNTLLKKSDIVTLHVPHNIHTHHLINKEAIRKMKHGVLLINTARGGIIDTEALVKGLKSGKIGGAGLDVLEGECFIKEEKQLLSKHFAQECDLKTILHGHLLMKMPNVIVTPHNAFNSREALSRILDTSAQNITSFLKGRVVNKVV